MGARALSHRRTCCVATKSCLTFLQLHGLQAHQDLLSMGFPRQEYWSGLPFPSPGDLPDPEIKPGSPALAGRVFTTEPPGKPYRRTCACMLRRVPLLVNPWTVACQTPLSMGFSRQDYWDALPCPPPGNLPNPVISNLHLLWLHHCRLILYHWTTRGDLSPLEGALNVVKLLSASLKGIMC